jgi:hypothetical protein
MKSVLSSVFVFVFLCSLSVSASEDVLIKNLNSSHTHIIYLDPGHNQKRGKDKSVIELYLGLQPSFAIKYNLSHSSSTTEKTYMMLGMDFDSDLFAKIGVVVNPGKTNKNRSLSNPAFGWIKLWRYVMIRQALELGYKGQMLDAEEDEKLNTNYSGLTANYSLIFDGNFLLDKTSWYFLDQRTARRIRLKVDAGIFFNLNKFNQPDLGFLSGSNAATGMDFNEDISDVNGQPTMVDTYPVLSPFVNLSIGFAF